MSPTLESLLYRGRRYVAECEAIAEVRPVGLMQDVGARAFRRHSSNMADIELGDAEALLAAVFGAVKWHERHALGGDHLNDCLQRLEDAMASLRCHFREEEEPELPLERAA